MSSSTGSDDLRLPTHLAPSAPGIGSGHSLRRVLVCGGRDFAQPDQMATVLALYPMSVLIHGGQRGADIMAGDWAGRNGITTDPYPVSEKIDGKWPGAGPKRNARMLRNGRPDLVLAFPGGKGTSNMVQQARRAGVPVVEVFI